MRIPDCCRPASSAGGFRSDHGCMFSFSPVAATRVRLLQGSDSITAVLFLIDFLGFLIVLLSYTPKPPMLLSRWFCDMNFILAFLPTDLMT